MDLYSARIHQLLVLKAPGVSWPSGIAYRTVLVLAAECGFESRP